MRSTSPTIARIGPTQRSGKKMIPATNPTSPSPRRTIPPTTSPVAASPSSSGPRQGDGRASGFRRSPRVRGRGAALPDRPALDEAPQHQKDADPFRDRQEKEEGPDLPDARSPDEDRIEHDLQSDERPKLDHRIVRGGRVEREPPLAPARDEGRDGRELEGEA